MNLDDRAYSLAKRAFWSVFWGGGSHHMELKMEEGVAEAIKAYMAEIERRVGE